MPWGAIMMVTGVTVLINLMSKIGGMALFAEIMAKQSTPYTVTLVAGFWSGLISAYASTIGVILPAFVPMAPDLLAKIGGTDLLGLLSSIILCGHVTDVSPLVHARRHLHRQRHRRPGQEEALPQHAHLGHGHDADRRHRLLVPVHRAGDSMTGR
ncbi:MAG: hypothetical protein MZU95_02605 [Desulfomicrobium escambiense]|nr:hypothetical protein [Desulfomicrobium escambiense]